MHITLSRVDTDCAADVTSSSSQTQPVTISDLVQQDNDILEIGSLKIRGLRLESIEAGTAHIAVQLKAGTFDFPAIYGNARTRISQDCSAFATITLGKGENGKLKIRELVLELSDPIIIENPATAFLEPSEGFWGRAKSSISDSMAKVQIRGLTIDDKGSVHFDGTLTKGGMFHTPLSEIMNDVVPNLDLDLRHIAASVDPTPQDQKFGLEFLKALGHVVGEAFYTAQIVVSPTTLSVQNSSIDFRAQEQETTAQIKGKLTLNKDLDFSLTADPKESFVDSLLGRMSLSASMNIEHPLQSSAHVAFKVDGKIGDLPTLDVSGHQLRAKSVTFAAGGEADVLQADKSISHGIGQIFCKLKDPRIQVNNTAVQLNGDLGANLSICDFESHHDHRAPSFKGNLMAFMNEGAQDPFTPSKRRELEINFRMHKSGRLSASPLHNPASNLINLPFDEAYGQTRSEPVLSGGIARMTTQHFNKKMEDVTKSIIREGNRVELLVDGRESYPRRIQFINEAKETIWLQTLIFQDDASGMVTARALVDAAKRGVKVCVIVDGQGSADDLKNVMAENQAYKLMLEAGVDLRLHNDAAVNALRDIIAVIVDNKLSAYTKDELVSGSVTKLVAVICEAVVKLQNGQLAIAEAQKSKLISALNQGLGRNADSLIDSAHLLLPTDKNGSVELGGLIDRVQTILKQVYSWHEKHFIVDGQSAILGGMNISDPYMFGGLLFMDRKGKISKGWRDTDILIDGPAVDDAAAAFAKNWHHLTGERPAAKPYQGRPVEGVGVQIIQHSPSIHGDNHITEFLAAHLNRLESGESAYFENAYFCASTTLSPLFDAMVNAAKRGVKIVVLTNSEMTSDLPAINNAAFHTYRDLLKAGVRIFERKDDRTIHSKIAVIGHEVAIVGSANLDNRSARVNSEVIAVVYDADFATKQRAVIQRDLDWTIAREVTREDLAAVSTVKSARFAAMSLIRDLC